MSYSNYSDIAARGVIESAKQGKMIGAVTALPSASDCNGCTVLFNGAFYYSNGTTWSEVAIHGDITVDPSLDPTSSNPVANKAIVTALAEKFNVSAMHTTSGSGASAGITAENPVTLKDFVNSSIATSTAVFKGTFNVVADLGLTTSATPAQVAAVLNTRTFTPAPTNNDYCFVFYDYASDPGNINKYERYKFSATSWAYEFTLNNSSFTAEQWAAISSGITSSKVVTYDGYNAKISDLQIGLTAAEGNISALRNELADTQAEVETKQRKISSVSIRVPISGGVVRVEGMTDSALVWVSPAPSSMEAYSAAGCYCTEQATDSLTFTVKKDAEAEMTVNVAWAV